MALVPSAGTMDVSVSRQHRSSSLSPRKKTPKEPLINENDNSYTAYSFLKDKSEPENNKQHQTGPKNEKCVQMDTCDESSSDIAGSMSQEK